MFEFFRRKPSIQPYQKKAYIFTSQDDYSSFMGSWTANSSFKALAAMIFANKETPPGQIIAVICENHSDIAIAAKFPLTPEMVFNIGQLRPPGVTITFY